MFVKWKICCVLIRVSWVPSGCWVPQVSILRPGILKRDLKLATGLPIISAFWGIIEMESKGRTHIDARRKHQKSMCILHIFASMSAISILIINYLAVWAR